MNLPVEFLYQLFVTRWILLFIDALVVGVAIKKYYHWQTQRLQMIEIKQKYIFSVPVLENREWFRGFWQVAFIVLGIFHGYQFSDEFQIPLMAYGAGFVVSAGIVGLLRFLGYFIGVYLVSFYAIVGIGLFPFFVKIFEPYILQMLP